MSDAVDRELFTPRRLNHEPKAEMSDAAAWRIGGALALGLSAGVMILFLRRLVWPAVAAFLGV